MRNLKRALSLALASVMLLGMMVVGAGAASYPDVDENDNIEAIEVLQAVGVMIGDERGFRPDDEVNRAEMARIMADLMDLDYDYYEAIPSQFTDVGGNYGWAKKYVDACAANGIIYGRGNGIYDPAAGVTAVEAASMMMRALGYFQHSGDYNGGFEASTVKQASEINLFSGIGGNAHDALNRNQVAQLALNTLRANMVYFTGDMGFEYEGLSVGYRSEYTPRSGSEAKYAAISALGDATRLEGTTTAQGQYYINLGEELYNGALKRSRDQDGFGALATRWSYKNTEIGLYTDDADYVLEGTVKSSELYATVGKAVAEKYTWHVYVDGNANWTTRDSDGNTVYIFDAASNGRGDIRDEVIANNNDDLAGTGRGTYTCVYLDRDATGASEGDAYVTIINTYAAEVTKVEDGKITLNDQDGSLEFETDECEEDDVVLYAKYVNTAGDWVVAGILGLAELVEGEATTVRAEKYVIIDGVTYNYNATFNSADYIDTASAGANVAIYLDLQGNIVYLGEAEEINDYALVLSVGAVDSKYTGEAEYGAQLILSDGSLLNVDLDKDYTDKLLGKGKAVNEEELKTLQTKLVGQVFSYSKNSNGSFELKDPEDSGTNKKSPDDVYKAESTDIIENGRSSIKMPEGSAHGSYLYANSSTVFVLNDESESDTTFNVYYGYENVPDVDAKDGTQISAYVNKGIVKVVYVTDGVIKGADSVIFIVGANAKENKNSSGETYYTYEAIVNGEATTINIKDNSNYVAIKTGEIGVFSRMTVDGDGYVTRLADTNIEVDEGSGVQKLTNSVYGYNYNEKSNSYVDHIAPSNKTVIGYLDKNDKLSVRSDLTTDKNDQVFVVTSKDDGELLGIFVCYVDDSEATPGKGDDVVFVAGDVTFADGKKTSDTLGAIADAKINRGPNGEAYATFTFTAPAWAETAKADIASKMTVTYDIYADGVKKATNTVTTSNYGELDSWAKAHNLIPTASESNKFKVNEVWLTTSEWTKTDKNVLESEAKEASNLSVVITGVWSSSVYITYKLNDKAGTVLTVLDGDETLRASGAGEIVAEFGGTIPEGTYTITNVDGDKTSGDYTVETVNESNTQVTLDTNYKALGTGPVTVTLTPSGTVEMKKNVTVFGKSEAWYGDLEAIDDNGMPNTVKTDTGDKNIIVIRADESTVESGGTAAWTLLLRGFDPVGAVGGWRVVLTLSDGTKTYTSRAVDLGNASEGHISVSDISTDWDVVGVKVTELYPDLYALRAEAKQDGDGYVLKVYFNIDLDGDAAVGSGANMANSQLKVDSVWMQDADDKESVESGKAFAKISDIDATCLEIYLHSGNNPLGKTIIIDGDLIKDEGEHTPKTCSFDISSGGVGSNFIYNKAKITGLS